MKVGPAGVISGVDYGRRLPSGIACFTWSFDGVLAGHTSPSSKEPPYKWTFDRFKPQPPLARVAVPLAAAATPAAPTTSTTHSRRGLRLSSHHRERTNSSCPACPTFFAASSGVKSSVPCGRNATHQPTDKKQTARQKKGAGRQAGRQAEGRRQTHRDTRQRPKVQHQNREVVCHAWLMTPPGARLAKVLILMSLN